MFYLVLMLLGQIALVAEPGFTTEGACEISAKQERMKIGEMFARGLISKGPTGENLKPSDVSIECLQDTSGDHKT